MERIFVEGKPDKILVMKLGFPRREIRRSGTKSTVYADLKKVKNCIGIVDEDPNPDPNKPMHLYQQKLSLTRQLHGLSLYIDEGRNNKVIILKGRLEDWIIEVCKKARVDITKYGLPDNGNELHKVINLRLLSFERLLQRLLDDKNVALLTLKEWLQ